MTIKVEITDTPEIEAIAEVHDACFPKGWDAEAISNMLAVPGTMAFIGFPLPAGGKSGGGHVGHDIASSAPTLTLPLREREFQAAGFALIRLIAGEAELLTICVLEDHRRQGVAGALVSAFCDWLVEQKAESVFLEVNEHNDAAIRLYQRHGFAVIARRNEYYRNEDGSHEHALVMRRIV